MSEYQKVKQRALELQREKEEDLKRELKRKAEKEKQQAKDDEERRKRLELQAKEARRKELMAANAVLTAASSSAGPSGTSGSSNAASTSIEYNPFAEDERRPSPSWSLLTGPSKPKSSRPGGLNGSRGSASRIRDGNGNGSSGIRGNGLTGGSSRKEKGLGKEASPPALGRKEKAARAFLQKAQKGSKKDQLFSIRQLVDGGDKRSASPPSTRPINGNQRSTSSQFAKSGLNRSPLPGSRKPPLEASKPMAMGRTVSSGGVVVSSTKQPLHSTTPGGIRNGKKRNRSESPVRAPKPKPPPIPSTARPVSRLPPPGNSRSQSQRRRSISPSSSVATSSDYETDEDEDDSRRRSGKVKGGRGRLRSPSVDPNDISAMIQGIFKRPGTQPRRYVDEDDSGSDMEAGLSDVEMEEQRAAKIARREDEIALREEEARRKAKEKLKRERERR